MTAWLGHCVRLTAIFAVPVLWVWATALAWEIGLYVAVPLGLVFGSAFQFLHVQSLKLGEPMSPPASLIRSQLN